MVSALAPLLATVIDGKTKGYPHCRPPLPLGDIGRQGWSLLAGDLDTPVALLRASAMDANAAWMNEFLRRTGVSLCPHGKTSMAPQLFHRQLADGAFGITLATVQEVRVALAHGVKRILFGNELVGAGAVTFVRAALDADPELDFTCLVDSLDAVRELEAFPRGERPLNVLLELGIPGGRAGARDPETAMAVARAVRASPHLRLRGVECFEGIVMSTEADTDRARVEGWLRSLGALAVRLATESLFETDEVLLTAGGSAYFDLVAAELGRLSLGRPARVLLRSGCYLFHDVGHYERLVARLEQRLPAALRIPGRLAPALEVWGRVVSRPEPGLALLDFGKRDVAHDLDLPRPFAWARPGADAVPRPAPREWTVVSLYDQHARLVVPPGTALAPGDLVGCGVSHPCTTFDKWQLLLVVDDRYVVTDAIRTFF